MTVIPLSLSALPFEIKMRIFFFIHFEAVFKYTRLSKAIREVLLTKQFILINRHMHNDPYDPSNHNSLEKINSRVLSMSTESAQGYAETRLSYRSPCRFRLRHCPTKQLPSTIILIPYLKIIYLHASRLSGILPVSLFDCIGLELLYLGLNNLTGPIPKEIGNLKNLKRLMLFQNKLTGSIPPEFGKLVNLEHCSMANNNLVGDIPKEISGLVSVKSLKIHIQNNGVRLAYPPEVASLKNLVSCAYEDGYDVCRPFLPENRWTERYIMPNDAEISEIAEELEKEEESGSEVEDD